MESIIIHDRVAFEEIFEKKHEIPEISEQNHSFFFPYSFLTISNVRLTFFKL